jgi:hypothetical protein
MPWFCAALLVVAAAVLAPSTASAQATLAGTVQDGTGAVLPGVTVEASSPALIERVRSTTTDSSGQYRITELRPGTYTLSFTLPGFSVVQRENVAVSGLAVITINAEMRVGGVQETITVTGETPLVDVRSTQRQAVLDNEVTNALPASRGYGNLLMAVPAIQINLLNSATDPTMQFFTVHGGRSNEGRVQIDGLNVGSSFGGGGVSSFAYDTSNADELQVAVSGGLGEADIGGPAINLVPRTGGNRFAGNAFFNNAGEWSQGSNVDDRLRAIGINESPALIKSWDASFSLGGPIKRDRLWFYGTLRSFGNQTANVNLYRNLNEGIATAWSYIPDLSVPSRQANDKKIAAIRLTTQLTPRNKVGFFHDYQYNCGGSTLSLDADGCRQRGEDWVGLGNFFGITAPESGTVWVDREKIIQGNYSSTLTSRLLLEAGASSFISRWGGQDPGGALTTFIPVTEQSARACTAALPCPGDRTSGTLVPFANFTYRGLDNRLGNKQSSNVWRGSMSYVTGSHSLKVGTQGAYQVYFNYEYTGLNQLRYQFNNGVANQFSMFVPRTQSNRTQFQAYYVQDSWTRGRMSLQGALRYERASSWHPEGENGVLVTSRFNAAPIVFPRVNSVNAYNDISPRVGFAYDLLGDGRTALKFHFGHYVQSADNSGNFVINNPAVTFQRSTNRSWTDNGNLVPDCDLMNPAAQDNRASGGDLCGQWSNLNFGSQFSPTTVNPEVLSGWGVRPWDKQIGFGIQQQILPRVSVEVSYNRRWFGNFYYTDNRAVSPADYDQVTIAAPQFAALPDGGGYPVSFVSLRPDKFGQTNNYFTFASDYGDDTRYWHGVDVSANARTSFGLTLQGGTSTGRGVRNNCEITALLPETLGTAQVGSCDVTEPWLTTLRGLASYTVPKADVLVSAVFRSQVAVNPGAVASNGNSLSANYLVSTATIQQILGRPIAGGAANSTVDLLLPGQLYQDRLNAVDMRFAKIIRFGDKRADVGLDLYNLFNANTTTSYNQAFGSDGSAWLNPTAILNPRFVRFNLKFDF